MLSDLGKIAHGLSDEVGLDDLRGHVLGGAVITCLAATIGLMLAFSHASGTEEWVKVAILGLYAVAALTCLAVRWGVRVGGATLVAGLMAVGTTLLSVASLSPVVYLMPSLVLFSTIFLGFLGGLAFAGLVTLDLVAARALGVAIAEETLWVGLALTWANVVLGWVASEPVRLALSWSWSHYLRAEQETNRARRQQAQLAQLVKSLNQAQDRLEAMNRDLERARRAADDARRLKAEFAATISHELRTPLNLIVGFSEMMVAAADSYADHPLPPVYQRDVDTIYRNARHLSSLIDDILDLSQIDAARLGLLRERMSLSDLAREAADMVEPLYRRKGLYLTTDIPADLPSVMVDRTRIRQVLVNLLGNAVRFTDKGGVRVGAWLRDRDVVVAVADTGRGIPPEALATVFEEFRQVDGPGGRDCGGSGLGLAISKRLVEWHGGSMWAEPGPGGGSVFYFTLPLVGNVVSAPIRHEWESWVRVSGEAGRHEKTVAVLDDDRERARLLQRYLDGYQVVAAGSVAEVGRLRTSRPVCAVVLTGPVGADIWGRAQQIRPRLGNLPVMVCPLPGRSMWAAELGVVDYLVKPILRESLASVLRRQARLARDVLVIDDDPDLVDLLARMTRSIVRKATVRRAYGGMEGLAALQAKRPDLVLLDLLMPEVDGYAVLKAMRGDSGLRDVPVVVVTARRGEEETIAAECLTVTRGSGLDVADLTRILKLNLDALTQPTTDSAPARRAGLRA